VAVVAIIATGDVSGILTSGDDAIMAIATTTQYLGMIDSQNWRENSRAVAVFTNVGRLHVRRILASRQCSVMAAYAVAGVSRMIESSG